MTTRPFDSIADVRVTGTAAAVLALLAFVLGYGVRGTENEHGPSPIAAGDAADLSFALIWGAMVTLGWAFRSQLRDAVTGSQRSRLLLVALAFAPLAVADAFSMQLAAAMWGDHLCPEKLASMSPLYGVLPRAGILGGTMLLVLLAWERHVLGQAARAPHAAPLQPAPASSAEWLDFPEAPLLRVRADDVVLIRSAGNYSEIVALGRAHLVRATLSELAYRLAPLGFVRVHRQTVINARNVRQISRDAAGRTLIHLACGEIVPVGRHYLSAIDALTR